MRKFVLLTFIIFPLILFGQDKYASYTNYFADKTYDIRIEKIVSVPMLYIDMLCTNQNIKNGSMRLEGQLLIPFLRNLSDVRDKFRDAISYVKTNDIDSLDKIFKIQDDIATLGCEYDYLGKHYFERSITPLYTFHAKKIKNEYIFLVNIYFIPLSADKQSGYVLTFISPEDVENFREIISVDAITSFFKRPKAEDLFQ